MRRLRNLVGPEHATIANHLLPDDTGGDEGGAGGDGTDSGTGQQQGEPQGQQQTGDLSPDAKRWKDTVLKTEARANAEKKRADELAAELDRIRQSQMSEAEKAVAAARAEGEQAGRLAGVSEAVSARLEAALAHLPEGQRDALIGSIRTDQFVKDGAIDRAAITAWAEAVAPKPSGRETFPPLGQGRQPAPKTTDMNALIRKAAGL